jgi:cell division septum initiation protein DivIVA
MSDFFGKLKSGAEKVAFEAEKMNRLNRAKGELEKLNNQVQAQYAKLGEMYYNQRESTGVTGPAYDDLCQAIAELEKQVNAKDEDIQRINAEVYSPQGAQPQPQPVPAPEPTPTAPLPAPTTPSPQPTPPVSAAKFCPNCGAQIPPETKFCPECGTKIPA